MVLRIEYIEINKFRSIEKCQITLDTVNAIVGQNNSGKSALIRALNAFFNPEDGKQSFFEGKHNYTVNSQAKITVKFTNIPTNADIQQFATDGIIEAQLTYKHSNRNISFKYKSNGRFVSTPQELIKIINKYVSFVYIPPNRSPDQLKWQEKSLIKELIEEYLNQETSRRDTLTPKFRKAAQFLEDSALTRISKDIESCYSLRHKFNFSLSFDKQANFLSFLSEIQMHINEEGIEHNLNDCGTGLQSLTIIAFHRVLAKIRNQNIVLGLEEPEINLHPQAQRELIKSIKSSSENNDISQVIVTTHSTVIIDNIEHKNISLVRKEPDRSRGFKSIITKTKDSFFSDHNLEEFGYYQFHDYRNSDFFFANYVIFVESKNDAEVVKHLAGREDLDLDLYGISVVDIGGVGNLPYPYHIVKELGIPYLIVLDKDYFLPYLNDELNSSRNGDGLPKYRYQYKTDTLLTTFIKDEARRVLILNHLKTNHSKAMNLLLDHNIICMKYCLEMDLLSSNRAVQEMSSKLNLRPEESNRNFLLTQRKSAVKKIGNIMHVLNIMDNRNLPHSFQRIKKEILEISKRC